MLSEKIYIFFNHILIILDQNQTVRFIVQTSVYTITGKTKSNLKGICKMDLSVNFTWNNTVDPSYVLIDSHTSILDVRSYKPQNKTAILDVHNRWTAK